jgi:hypothetical protein
MPKDKVGAPGDVMNKRISAYCKSDTNSYVKLSLKEEAYNSALLTAMGFSTTVPALTAGDKMITTSMKELIDDHNFVPVTIKFIEDDQIKSHKTVVAPGVDPTDLMGTKYHGTLDIVKVIPGWSLKR